MKSPLVIGLVFFGAIVVAIFWTWPSYENLSARLLREQEVKTQLKTRAAYFQSLADVNAKLQQSKDQVAKLNAAFPSDETLPLLYREIQQVSASSGLVLKQISASPPQGADNLLKTIEVNLALTGSYASLKDFLLRSLSASRVLQVESVAFSYPKTRSASAFDFHIRLNAYSY